MSSATICKIEDVNVENFMFKGPKKDDSRYNVHITHKLDSESLAEKVYLQTPKMKLNSSLEESFVDFNLPTNIDFIKFMCNVDEKILMKIKENKTKWFEGKSIEDSFFEIGQIFSVRSETESGTSKIKLRVPTDTIIYNSNKEEVDAKSISIDSEMSAILQLVGIWFTKTRWGLTWKTIQLKEHKKKREIVKTYLFDDVEDDDLEDILDPPPGLSDK